MMHNYAPREYQAETIESLWAALMEEKNVLLAAIMGAGKTFISSRIVSKIYTRYPDKRILCLMHKKELILQFQAAFNRFTKIKSEDVGICCTGISKNHEIDKKITIGSIQTFINYLDEYPGANLVIIDECHRININAETQYKKIIDALREKQPSCRIQGLTATPFRLNHGYIYGDKCSNGSKNLFPKIHHKINYSRLLNEGYLMPLHGKVCNDTSLTADLKTVDVSGDFNLGQLGAVMSKNVHVETAVAAIERHCQGYKKIVIFACTIEHAEKILDALQAAGHDSGVIHSKLSTSDRDDVLQAFMNPDGLRIIVGVNILSEGWDFPACDCIVMARPTLSPVLFLQVVGRILRKHPDKEKSLLVDLTDNTLRFGTDLDNVRVEIPGRKQKKNDPPVKICPMCDTVLKSAVKICPDCGFEWEVEEPEYQEAKALPELENVVFEPVPPEWHEIYSMQYSLHKKEGKPESVKIEYFNGRKIASEWLCPEHGGYPTFKYKKWFRKRSNMNPPKTAVELLSILTSPEFQVRQPVAIEVDKNSEYPEIRTYRFAEKGKAPPGQTGRAFEFGIGAATPQTQTAKGI